MAKKNRKSKAAMFLAGSSSDTSSSLEGEGVPSTPCPPSGSAKKSVAQKSPKERVEGVGADEEGKKSAYRLWSEDDETAVLKGILEFREKKGVDPLTDGHGFHEFIKKSLQVKIFNRKQLLDKVRKLKKRYENNIDKKKIFSPREGSALDLSAKIWGKDAVADVAVNPTTGSKAAETNDYPKEDKEGSPLQFVETDNSGKGSGWRFIGKASVSMGLDENMVKVGLELCSEDSKTEMDNKWKQFYLEESDLFIRKLDLAREETRLIREALKSAGE